MIRAITVILTAILIASCDTAGEMGEDTKAEFPDLNGNWMGKLQFTYPYALTSHYKGYAPVYDIVISVVQDHNYVKMDWACTKFTAQSFVQARYVGRVTGNCGGRSSVSGGLFRGHIAADGKTINKVEDPHDVYYFFRRAYRQFFYDWVNIFSNPEIYASSGTFAGVF